MKAAFQKSTVTVPRLACFFHDEPSLEFGGGREHVDPKTGIAAFGPRFIEFDARHPLATRVGIIGSGRSLDSARAWLASCIPGVDGDEINVSFPGYDEDRGFFSRIILDSSCNEYITQHEIADLAKVRLRKDRFSEALALVGDKLRLLSERDQSPDVILLALPDELLEHCQTVDFIEKGKRPQHRDFRRALKAEAMKYRIPTQIMRQRLTEATVESRSVDHKARCAWNFFTGFHFKAGGLPWGPKGLARGTCYVGISFFRPLEAEDGTLRTSVAQAFDEHGEGIVLRGQDFQWDEAEQGKSPHLNEEQSALLLQAVLKRYEDELKQKPARVVIHKTSRFWQEERIGFQSALREIKQFDLVSVSPQSRIRLLRTGQYPVLRGTRFVLGDMHFLYTTGYLASMRAYPHGHVPSALQIADHWGDTPISVIADEILALTKLNWNSSAFGGLMPITLKFSRLVGDIMKEIPAERDPLPQFKFYM